MDAAAEWIKNGFSWPFPGGTLGEVPSRFYIRLKMKKGYQPGRKSGTGRQRERNCRAREILARARSRNVADRVTREPIALSIKGIGLAGSLAAAEEADATKRMGIIYREALCARACALRLHRSLRFGDRPPQIRGPRINR